jgi:hypothetical protein
MLEQAPTFHSSRTFRRNIQLLCIKRLSRSLLFRKTKTKCSVFNNRQSIRYFVTLLDSYISGR